MGSGTSSLREMKPDPMPAADGRDAHPYLCGGPAGTLVPTSLEWYSRADRGWRFGEAARCAIDSVLDAVLCTLHSVLCTLYSASFR